MARQPKDTKTLDLLETSPKKKRGRKSILGRPLTAAERKARSRAVKKSIEIGIYNRGLIQRNFKNIGVDVAISILLQAWDGISEERKGYLIEIWTEQNKPGNSGQSLKDDLASIEPIQPQLDIEPQPVQAELEPEKQPAKKKATVTKKIGNPPALYRNPENQEQTWTGRGKRPTWVIESLVRGLTLDDLRKTQEVVERPKATVTALKPKK